MNSEKLLRVGHSQVAHFNPGFENDFMEFKYKKVTPSKSHEENKMIEKQKAVLKKNLGFTCKSSDSKEHTPPESSKTFSPTCPNATVSPPEDLQYL